MCLQLKDLAGLSEPITEFVKTVSRYVERRSEPARIRNEAAARADALRIEAQAQADISEIRQRSALRLQAQDIQNQVNLERIVYDAARQVKILPAKGFEMNDDWLHRFFIEAQEISDERLQALWSKLLSAEFQSPGRFSRRVFRLLKELDPSDLAIIEETGAKVLTVTDYDGMQKGFLNVDIYEEWFFGAEREKQLLGTTLLTNTSLLQELGLIEYRDKEYSLDTEGEMVPEKIHLSDRSPRCIGMGNEAMYFHYIQPGFIRNRAWLRNVILDGWQITTLGEQVFRLNTKSPNLDHFRELRSILLKSEIEFSPNPPQVQQ